MKKIILASLSALVFSLSAMAQTATPPASDKKEDMKELRKDIRDVHKDKAHRRHEIKEGDKASAKEITKDIRADKKDIREDANDLRADGVKHPVKKAEKQILRARRNHK